MAKKVDADIVDVRDVMKEITGDFAKAYKDDSVTSFEESKDFKPKFFYPTGIVTLDVALGGGLAAGGCSEVYGNYSCGKSTTAYAAIAETQKLFPNKICVLVDLETSAFGSEEHMAKMGIDFTRLIHIKKPNDGKPFYAEDAFERTEDIIRKYGSHIALVIVDSMGAVVSKAEGNNDKRWDKGARVGGASSVNAMFLRNTVDNGLIFEHDIHLMMLNQVRDDIGNMFNEFRTPGGNKIKFVSVQRIEVTRNLNSEYKNPKYKQGDPLQTMYIGQRIRYKAVKNKVGGKEGATASVEFFYETGLDVVGNYFDMACYLGLVTGGGWKTFTDPRTGEELGKYNGTGQWIKALNEDQTLWHKMYYFVQFGIRGEMPPEDFDFGGVVDEA